MTDLLEKHRDLATALQIYGIACPGLQDGGAFTVALGQLDDVIRAADTPASVREPMRKYYEDLLTVAAIWLAQKSMVLARLANTVSSTPEGN